jgi:OOP family OmpA-OmpF porin
MGTRVLKMLGTVAAMLLALPASAGYWFDSSGEVWRSGAGECVHTGYWNPDMSIVGCDGRVAERAAPPPTPVARPAPPPPRPAPVAVMPAEQTVNFGFDRADLDTAATASIDAMVDQARRQGGITGARLTGHADRIGTEEYNLDLSLRRASSVSDYLVRRTGLDPQAIEIGGKGESQPLVGCEGVFGAEAIRCLAPNRRVEIVLDVQAP